MDLFRSFYNKANQYALFEYDFGIKGLCNRMKWNCLIRILNKGSIKKYVTMILIKNIH